MSRFDEPLRVLQEAAKQHEACVVAYSNGKDSRAVMDMCVRTFRRVEAFFMYLAPGLEVIDNGLAEAEARYGIKIRQYPHWTLIKYLRNGVYCDPWYQLRMLPEWKLRDIYNLARVDAKAGFVVTGAKLSDGAWRRRFIVGTKGWTDVLNPLADWTKHDVYGYLKARNIPIPDSSGKNATGISLVADELFWLKGNYPEDFERLVSVFKYAEAPLYRKQFYG